MDAGTAVEPRRVMIHLSTGERVDGTLAVPAGMRLIRFLNSSPEPFLEVSRAQIGGSGGRERVGLIAVHRAHIVAIDDLSE